MHQDGILPSVYGSCSRNTRHSFSPATLALQLVVAPPAEHPSPQLPVPRTPDSAVPLHTSVTAVGTAVTGTDHYHRGPTMKLRGD